MHEQRIREVPGSPVGVVMLHGIAGTPDHFRFLEDRIPESWSVYNLLLPGHGSTVRAFGRSSLRQWRSHARQYLDRCHGAHERMLLIGHSMGTLFALEWAMDHPDARVELLLLNCPMKVKYPPATAWLCLKTAFGHTSEHCLAMARATSVALTPRLWQYLSWIPRVLELLGQIRRVRARLPELTAPGECFHSARDELVRDAARRVLEDCPGLKLRTLTDSGHFDYDPKDRALLLQSLERLVTRLGSL